MNFLNKKILFSALMLLLGLALTSNEAFAQVTDTTATQADGATLSGTVMDSNSQALSEITVAIVGQEATATTDDEGKFSFNGIEAGTHTVKVEAEGYQTWEKEVAVTADGKELDVQLKAGSSDSEESSDF